MTNVQTELSENLLRRLALMQHLGEDFFIWKGTAYTGNHKDLYEEWIETIENLPDAQTWDEFIKDNCTEIEELEPDNYNEDYRVLTDEEADEAWEESLDSYIEECIEPEIEKITEGQGNLGYYITFNEEMWKRDAKMDGRGHSLSSYDGHEIEETVEGTTFYIYRIN